MALRTTHALAIATLISLTHACSSGEANESTPATPAPSSTQPVSTGGAQAASPAPAQQTRPPVSVPPASSVEGGSRSASPAAGSGAQGPSAAAAGTPASEAGAAAMQPELPELPMEFTNVDVTQTIKRRFGAPHVAVNPKDPNNIIVLASSNLGYTRDCVPPPPGSDCEMIAAGGNFLLQQPRGFAKTPGFMDIGVYTSFDRGKTFSQVNIDDLVPPGHPEVRARGEGPIAATPDGTFYIGFNAINWGNWESEPMTFFPNGGVGVIKSTDGGKSWTWASYSFTPADWPYGGSDPVTGTFYVTSGLVGLSTLGSRSNGMPGATEGTIADRWIASTNDGTTWTEPKPLGGSNGGQHIGAGHSPVAAANGVMATLFVASDASSCSAFVQSSAAPCVVFQTSTDSGATWDRKRVPTPQGFRAAALSVLLSVDPTHKGQFTVALLSESGDRFLVFTTPDEGKTWGEAVTVSEDASKTHFAPFVASSPKGELGMMWRTYEPDPQNRSSPPTQPYSVWAVISKDGGKTFSRPLKVSKANSPAPPDDPQDSFAFVGDHGPSGMAMDGDNGVYVVWADWTPGERAIFFSAINAQAFSFE